MLQRLLFLGGVVLLLIPGLAYAQQPSIPLTVSLEPGNEIRQGQTALLRVFAPDLTRVRASFIGKTIDLHRSSVGDWIGLLAVDMEDDVGDYSLDIYVWIEGQSAPIHNSQAVSVIWGTFDYQDIPVPYSLEPLLDQDLNAQDFGTLERIYQRTSPERLFTTFVQPIPGPIISQFGGIRNYNDGQLRGRHTGVDYRAVIGTIVGAVSDGRVVFASHLPIHGNHVVIDHGWGVLSGYSHLSEISVVPGQLVRQGAPIGLSGATGRVQGPHLHFEMAVNGIWIDAGQFLELSIPMAAE